MLNYRQANSKISQFKLYLLIICAVLIVLGKPYHSGTALVGIGTIALSLFWILEGDYKRKIKVLMHDKVLLLFIFLYILYPIALFYTENQPNGRSNVEKHLAYLALPLIILTSEIPSKYLKVIKKAFFYTAVSGILFCLLVAFTDFLITGEMMALVGENLQNKFTSYGLTRAIIGWHPTYVSMYLNVSWIYLFTQLLNSWNKSGKLTKILYIVGIIMIIFSVVLLNSINGIFTLLGLILIIPGYYLIKLGRIKTLLISVILLFSLITTIVFSTDSIKNKTLEIVSGNLTPTDNAEERNALTIRLAKWESGMDVIKDNILIGVGPGDTKEELQKVYLSKNYNYLYEKGYNAHNQFIETLIAFGLLGFIPLLLLFIYLILYSLRKNNILLLSSVFVLMTAGLTESVLDRQQGIMFFSFLLPILYYESKTYYEGNIH